MEALAKAAIEKTFRFFAWALQWVSRSYGVIETGGVMGTIGGNGRAHCPPSGRDICHLSSANDQ